MTSEQRKKLEKKAIARGLAENGGVVRHVLICTQSGCCKDKDEAKTTLKVLNKGLKQLREDSITVYSSEVECLKLCQNGPLMVVYPEGTWYGRVTPEVCERVIEKHLRAGQFSRGKTFSRAIRSQRNRGKKIKLSPYSSRNQPRRNA